MSNCVTTGTQPGTAQRRRSLEVLVRRLPGADFLRDADPVKERRESGRDELGPLDVPRAVPRDPERPPPCAPKFFEAPPNLRGTAHRPCDAVDVPMPEIFRVVAEP
ncbi:hypothetical protein GCM10010448_23570 [Streptomyces glomeratus]|uniref:Uncharacterized protein n=1 Tax=Streptomyces glomeratus TaxID=284452 RepID=A0ABP6LEI4_9ACTN